MTHATSDTRDVSADAVRAEAATMSPARFPSGEQLLPKLPLREEVFETVHDLVQGGECPDGRLEVETPERRLTCLFHRGKAYAAGLQDGDLYSSVPLYEFPARALEMRPASCRLVKSDPTEVLIAGVHFQKQPDLRGGVRFVDPARVLKVLAAEHRDAALSFLRDGRRTLLFLHQGKPARLFFGDSKDDPGEGSLEERVLLYAFGPQSTPGVVEVFTDLRLIPDPDAGASLRDLVEAASPAPPATVFIHMDGHEVRQRPFTAPSMVVGRDPKVDLFIDNLGVSRKHALLSWHRGSFVIEDLGSSNGTYVGADKIARHVLQSGDKVRMGKFELTVVRTQAEQQAAETLFVSRMNLKSLLPPPLLVGDGIKRPLDRPMLVGKGDGVEVKAKGFGVASVHARITPLSEYGKFRIDCFGGRKVKVGGRSESSVELGIDTPFRIGRSTFKAIAPAMTGEAALK